MDSNHCEKTDKYLQINVRFIITKLTDSAGSMSVCKSKVKKSYGQNLSSLTSGKKHHIRC